MKSLIFYSAAENKKNQFITHNLEFDNSCTPVE